MNLLSVAGQIRSALTTQIAGLRVPVWGDEPSAGAGGVALIGWPERLEPASYQNGKLRAPDWPVFLIAPGSDRATHQIVSDLIGDNVAKSARLAVENFAYTACDFVVVASVEIDPAARYQGNPVVAAVLHLDVNGTGK